MGPHQRPFRYARPDWLAEVEPLAGEHSRVWLATVAFVATHANESGFFAPEHPQWLLASGLTESQSLRYARRFAAAGALEQIGDRWYVARWRELYRASDFLSWMSE